MPVHFNKVTIIGVGLIGGSLAKVLKAKNLAGSITGAGRSRETLELALRLGVIDHMGQGPVHAVEGADLVVLASPVGTFESVVREIGPHLKKGAILTDVGSVKGELVRRIEALLPAGVHFVPGPPDSGQGKVRSFRGDGDAVSGRQVHPDPDEKNRCRGARCRDAKYGQQRARTCL